MKRYKFIIFSIIAVLVLLWSLRMFVFVDRESSKSWIVWRMPSNEKKAYNYLARNGAWITLFSAIHPWDYELNREKPRWIIHSRINLNRANLSEVKESLEVLDPKYLFFLRDSGLNDERIKIISDLKSLWWLYISGSDVSDASIVLLASLPSLTYVEASDTKITYRSLLLLDEHLTNNDWTKKEFTLHIHHCKVPRKLHNEISRKHPNLLIGAHYCFQDRFHCRQDRYCDCPPDDNVSEKAETEGR